MPTMPPPGPARRLLLMALAGCALAVAAAVVSFARGSLLGVIWVLLAGVTSNIAWFHLRRGDAGPR